MSDVAEASSLLAHERVAIRRREHVPTHLARVEGHPGQDLAAIAKDAKAIVRQRVAVSGRREVELRDWGLEERPLHAVEVLAGAFVVENPNVIGSRRKDARELLRLQAHVVDDLPVDTIPMADHRTV